VVLADGRIVDCDDQRHEELFWALRGAGAGNFGVVTSLAFRTVPAPATTTYHLVWPHTRAADVVREWQAWAPDGPDELTASLLLTASADPAEPPLVNLFGAMIGSRSDADELLEQLVDRVGTPPAPAEFTHLPYRDAKQHLAERGPGEDRPLGHLLSKSEFVGRALPAEVVQSLVDNLASSRVAGQSRALDFLPWSGAYNRVRPDATAFAHRTARFLLKHTAVVDPDTPTDDLRATRSWLTRSWALVHRWGTGGVYPSFPDADLENWAAAYYGDNYDRLVRVKARYDPTGFFRFHQSLPTRALQPA
jgi:FAD/FMN-containing dehydrogenase